MEFKQLQESWNRLGATDPRWAILTEAGREGGKWDDASFWQSGVSFVDWVASYLAGLGLAPKANKRALDFGCGQGRLTQALTNYFDEVVGVDIAESMLEAARRANRFGDRVKYVHNARPDLSVFPSASFDCVLTVLVLQHMRPEYSAQYLREFMRVLRPGGVAFFQIPIEPLATPTTPSRTSTAAARTLQSFALNANSSIVPPLVYLPASTWLWYRVTVHNRGSHTLHARSGPGQIEVGARFQKPDGQFLEGTTWTPLPHDIAPGESAHVLLAMRTPTTAGNYGLAALPCVGRRWCEHSGNVAAVCRAGVTEAPPTHVMTETPPPKPQMPGPNIDGQLIEVYGTPMHELHSIISSAGGELREVALDVWAGHEWISAHCVVTRN
ncbi:MAG: class I SAM-dependent methyltransferase [Planctomycetota bacterium]